MAKNYTAADIKELRERTGAGMLDVKKALDETDGDKSKAQELLRIKGLKGVTKREGRTATNGLVVAQAAEGVGTLVEVLCETDFVAKGEVRRPRGRVLAAAVAAKATDADSLLAAPAGEATVKELLDDANATIGEKIEVKRVARVEAPVVSAYLHKTSLTCRPRSVSSPGTDGGDAQVARDVAMHIAAFSPNVLTWDELDADVVANERRIAEETAKEEGKPEAALPKIVEGRVHGFFKENVLLDQPFAKDSKKSVGKVLEEAGANATQFARFRVGS